MSIKKPLFILLFTIALIPGFFAGRYDVNHAFYNSLIIIPVGIIILYNIIFNGKAIRIKNLKTSEFAVAILLVFLMCFMFPIWDIWTFAAESESLLTKIWGFAILLPLFILSCLLLSFKIITWFITGKENGVQNVQNNASDSDTTQSDISEISEYHSRKSFRFPTIKNKWISLLIIGIISCIFLFSTYPGVFISDDANWVWTHLEADNMLNDHTLGYTLFVKLCSYLNLGMFSVNLVQTIIWILINLYVLGILDKYSKKSLTFYTAIISVSVTPFLYLEVLYKDTVFSMGFLALTASIYNIIKQNKIKKSDFIVCCFATLFVTLCRHGAWIGTAVGFLLLLIYLFKKNKKELLKFLPIPIVHITSFFIIYGVILNVYNVQNTQPNAMWGTPLTTIAAAAVDGVEFDEEDRADLERLMPIEDWAACYNKYWTDSIGRHWGAIGGERFEKFCELVDNEGYGMDILRINAKLVFTHPISWFRAFLGASNLIWQVSEPADFHADQVPYGPLCYVSESEEIEYHAMYEPTIKSAQFYNEIPILHTLFLRGGVSFFILLLSIIVLLLSKKKRYILAVLPILVYNLSLCLAIPASDARYALPEMESAIFIFALLVEKKGNSYTVDDDPISVSE